MRLYPPEPQIADEDGFTPENDIFGLREFGESLTNLVTSVDQPLVLTLDGPWGSGKSTFAKQWAGMLRHRGLPVILFDAFANDHQDDAFIALSAEIMAQAQELKSPKPLRNRFATTAKKAGSVLTPVAVKAGFRLLSAGLISGDDLTSVEEGLKATSDDVGALLESAIGERLQRVEEDRKSLDAFRNALKELAAGLSQKTAKGEEGSQQGPLVFIIDELDRCRPPFALSILERIKHLFSVEGVCFVLVTNLAQLEAAVRGAYGTDTEAHGYLEKFFHIRVRLPNYPRLHDQTGSGQRYLGYLWKHMLPTSAHPGADQQTFRIVDALAQKFDLQLRSLERVVGTIALTSAAATPQRPIISPIVAPLAVMRLLGRDLYDDAKDGKLTWSKAEDFLNPQTWVDREVAETVSNWWRIGTGGQLPDDEWIRGLGRVAAQLTNDPGDLLPLMIELMEDFNIVDGGMP